MCGKSLKICNKIDVLRGCIVNLETRIIIKTLPRDESFKRNHGIGGMCICTCCGIIPLCICI